MKGFRIKHIFLILSVLIFAFLAYTAYMDRNTYIEDMVNSAFWGKAYEVYKNLFADLVTSRDGTYAEIIDNIFRNTTISSSISALILLVVLLLSILGISIPLSGLITFIISILNIDTYLFTSNVEIFNAASKIYLILSLVPVLLSIFYIIFNRREKKKLKAKQNG